MWKNKIEYFLFINLSRLIGLFPISFSRKIAHLIAFIFYYFIPIRKRVARENIKRAFPDKTPLQIRKILVNSYINFATVFIEILYIYKLRKEEIKNFIRIEDDLVNKFKSEGKGVILLSAHFGNWEILAASSAVLDCSYSIVVKEVRNNLVDRFMNNLRSKWGNKVIKLTPTMRELIKEIREKKIIAILADQRAPIESPKIKFFGKETSVFTGPAYLSIKLNTPILCYFCYRDKDGTYIARSHPIEYDTTASEQEKIMQITKRYFEILEKEIRKYPDHWLWFHDRWKH